MAPPLKTITTRKGTEAKQTEKALASAKKSEIDAETFIDLDPKSLTLELLLKELNSKMAVVFEIKNNTNFYAEQYDELLKIQKEHLNIIKSYEKKIESLNNKCQHLETVNTALEIRVHNIEQAEKNHNLEITGLDCKPNENIKALINTLADKLDVEKSDLESVERAWRVTKGKRNGDNTAQNAPIILKFKTTTARDAWYSKRGRIRKNSDVYTDGSDAPVYINENLTKFNKELLWNAKQKLKPTYKYIWVKYGRVFCKKEDASRVIPIFNISDIIKLHTTDSAEKISAKTDSES